VIGMTESSSLLTIGELADRSGVATSALRYYEARGLIASERTEGNQRRFARATLRRVAFIRAAQTAALSLNEIGRSLAGLPAGRNPTRDDWERLSGSWRERLDTRIEELTSLRDDLSGCIGCGCLSLDTCGLFNANDRAGARGPGARYLLGDSPPLRRVDRDEH
jgi:MerR family redox-sensitive transcriptional activator SoxR